MSNNKKNINDELYEHHNIKVDKYQSLLRIDRFLIDKIPGTFHEINPKTVKIPKGSGADRS